MDNVEQIHYEVESEILIPIGISLKCAVCNDGYLECVEPDGPQISNNLAIWPMPAPTYLHNCTNEECTNHGYFERQYPALDFEPYENHIETEG